MYSTVQGHGNGAEKSPVVILDDDDDEDHDDEDTILSPSSDLAST